MNPETMVRFTGWTLITVGSVVFGLGAVGVLFTWSQPWMLASVAALVGALFLVIQGIRYVTKAVAVPGPASGA